MFKTTVYAKAVRHALEKTDIGHQSSIEALVAMADAFYNGKPATFDSRKTACYSGRAAFRKANGLKADCRTYEGQPRRDMRNDSKLSLYKMGKVRNFVNKIGSDEIATFLGYFHSIDQAKLAVTTAKAMNQFVELV